MAPSRNRKLLVNLLPPWERLLLSGSFEAETIAFSMTLMRPVESCTSERFERSCQERLPRKSYEDHNGP
jgi:hypothetical protein